MRNIGGGPASHRGHSAATAEATRRAATFGRLTGNTDMHFGNLSFLFSLGSALSLASMYDMLPMMYAPATGDELPERKFEPVLPVAANLDIWPSIAERAAAYWQQVAAHELISADFATTASKIAASVTRARKLVSGA